MSGTRQKRHAKPKGPVENYLYTNGISPNAKHKEHNLLVTVANNQELLAVLTDPATGWYKKFNDGTTDLHLAAVRGDVERIKEIFVENPDRMLESTVRNESVLSWANYFERYEVIRYLLTNQAFVLKMELESAEERKQDLARGRELLAEIDAQADCIQEDSIARDDATDVATDSFDNWSETAQIDTDDDSTEELPDDMPVPFKLERQNAFIDLTTDGSPAESAVMAPVSQCNTLVEAGLSIQFMMLQVIQRELDELATLRQGIRSDLAELKEVCQIQLQRMNAILHQGLSAVDELATDVLTSVSSTIADIQPLMCLPAMPSVSQFGLFAVPSRDAQRPLAVVRPQETEMIDMQDIAWMKKVN